MEIISILQVLVSVLLVVVILMQQRGAGLGSTFGGDMGGFHTKRGIEKFLFQATIILAILFLGLAIASFIIASKG